MGRPFRRKRRPGLSIEVCLEEHERQVLAQIFGEVAELLDDGITDRDPLAELVGMTSGAAPVVPQDPALARLLPEAHREDPELSGEFRRLTEHGLRTRKRAGLLQASEALVRDRHPVMLSAQEAQAVLRGLTDVRLVLAERLGLHTDEDAIRLHQMVEDAGDSDDPWVARAAVYDVLTWWQEALLEALGGRH